MVKSACPLIINEKAASQSGTHVGSCTENSVQRREKPSMNADQFFRPFLIGSLLQNFLCKIEARYGYRMGDTGTVITKAVWKAAAQPTCNRC